MSKKYVYLFSEGNANMRELLGGKGANLAEMTNIGLPVPQGFTITTEACTQYYEDGQKINDGIQAEIMEYITKLEGITDKKFGDLENPLLVSVRSGARASMPGMMDTILNLGLNEDVVDVLAKKSGNPRWAWDCYRRFIQMYSDVVMEVGKKYFEQLIDQMKEARGVTQDVELTADDLKELAGQFKAEYKSKIGQDFPTDPKEQLMGAIKAVFRSWDNPRANVYRRDNDIPYSWGTAVNVQSMAFGNMGDDCGTGVAFTRNPATGEKKLFGEFLTNAQGEDVVAGIRTPMPISEMSEKFPEAFAQFEKVCKILEDHYHDMQDMEFTVENGKLYMLQTRNGKRTPAAALKIACDLVDEGMIDEKQAVAMIDPRTLDTLLHPQFDGEVLKKTPVIGSALAASPGAACGKVVFSAEDAKAWAERGEKVVLVRLETSPEDIEGMKAAQGILTVRGGMTSHAAVVARGMGKCCVSGCGAIKMDEENKQFELSGKTFHEGDWLSIDGSTGKIYDGAIPTVDASIGGEFGRVMGWADQYRRLKVRTNADTPHDAAQARKFGAEGIGLCRTEHMFFDADRIPAIRRMICSDTVEQREAALAVLEPMQQSDFEGIYEAMEGLPVTIRFLDPPPHEFVPTAEAAGAPYVQAALQNALGDFGPVFIAISMALFAFTTLIGNYYYCEGCLRFIFKKTPSQTFMTVFRIIAAVIVLLGAVISMQLAWDTADLFQALMVVINMPVILILGRTAIKALKDYTEQRKAGKNPEFKAANIGLKEKTMAAYRHGIKTVIIPAENQPDLKEVDETVKSNIQFVPVETLDTVLEWALVPQKEEEALPAGEQTKEAAVVPPVKKTARKSAFLS